MTKVWTTHRAKVASLSRSREPNDPELLAAREDLKVSRATEYIQALVDSAPPLSDESRAKLAALLVGA